MSSRRLLLAKNGHETVVKLLPATALDSKCGRRRLEEGRDKVTKLLREDGVSLEADTGEQEEHRQSPETASSATSGSYCIGSRRIQASNTCVLLNLFNCKSTIHLSARLNDGPSTTRYTFREPHQNCMASTHCFRKMKYSTRTADSIQIFCKDKK
jgi:hypothetical protein